MCIAIPTPAELNQQQCANTLSAYRQGDFDYSTSTLHAIVAKGVTRKANIAALLGNDTLVFTQNKTQDELVNNSFTLCTIVQEYPELSFNFPNKQVTTRDNGKCLPLKKWLQAKFIEDEAYRVDELIRYVEEKRILFISCNPWFLMGSSVSYSGRNVESSCHHPASSTADYKSGPISYALDNHTIVFGVWDSIQNGMIGRQLVYVDMEAPGIITGRKYGQFHESDSTLLRSELYKFFKDYKSSAWKRSKGDAYFKYYSIKSDGYCGYLDDGYFEGYRPQTSNSITIELEEPMCVSCGSWHMNSNLNCCSCSDDSYKCYACDSRVSDGDEYVHRGNIYCEECYNERFFSCDRCGSTYDRDDEVYDAGSGCSYCSFCAEDKNIHRCEYCGDSYRDLEETTDGEYYCEDHMPRGYSKCEECNKWEKYCTETIEGMTLCDDCRDQIATCCDDCGEYTTGDTVATSDGLSVCETCKADKYPYACPHCGEYHGHPGACCEDCATACLFDSADSYQDNAIAA